MESIITGKPRGIPYGIYFEPDGNHWSGIIAGRFPVFGILSDHMRRPPSPAKEAVMKSPARMFLGVLVLLVLSSVAVAAEKNDEELITQAVLNYTNSIYEVKPGLIDESVHARLQKVGYAPGDDGTGYREMWMTHEDLKELTAHWNKDGHLDAATAKRGIRILDQMDQIAVVRLDAEWGVDYIHLAKKGEKWMIMNVIWQTYPAE